MSQTGVTELRLVITTDDYDATVDFYRDALGLPPLATHEKDGGRLTIFGAGRATMEIADPAYAAYIDEVEVGQRVAGQVRVAFEVPDSATSLTLALEGGATQIAPPTRTPWGSLNARIDAPGGMQLTLFSESEELQA